MFPSASSIPLVRASAGRALSLSLLARLAAALPPAAAGERALDAAVAAGPAGTASVTRGPYLQVGTPTGIVIRWRTASPAESRVHYGLAPGGATDTAGDGALATEHEVALTGLSPGTRYYYAIGAGPPAGADSTRRFVTAPADGTARPTRIWVIGDSGSADAGARVVRDAYRAHAGSRHADVWLMLGDNAYPDGTDADYQAAVFDMYPDLLAKTAVWPTRGNHDGTGPGGERDYFAIFTLPAAGEAGGVPSGTEAYYSFDHGNIHFVCLDSQGSDRSPGGPMLAWLRRDLAATRKEWIVAYWHHAPYSKGTHNSDNPNDSGGRMRQMRENALPILDSTGVDLVLSGHSHSYERSFLVNGHYGRSNTLTPGMIVDGGDGRVGGDGPYRKPTLGAGPFEGAVYAVVGSSSLTGGGPLNHAVMVSAWNVLGSLVVDVDRNRLDARFVDGSGAVRDSFTIVKGPGVAASPPGPEAGTWLAAPWPNPSAAWTRFSYALPRDGRVELAVHDLAGRRIATLASGARARGRHVADWEGRDERGRALPAGIYFAVLDFDGERRVRRLVRVR